MPEIESIHRAGTCYMTGFEDLNVSTAHSTRPLNEVVSQLLTALSKNSDEYLALQNRAIGVAQKLHEEMFKELELAQVRSTKYTWRENVIHRISAAILPLALATTAGLKLVAHHGPKDPKALAIAAIAVGGLLLLESLLDEPAQQKLASLLSRGSEESTETWLGRFHLVTSVAALGLTVGVGAENSVQIASNSTKLSLECVSTGVQWQGDRNHAHLTDLSLALGENDRQLKFYGGEVQNLAQTYEEFSRRMQEMLESEKAACRQIFA